MLGPSRWADINSCCLVQYIDSLQELLSDLQGDSTRSILSRCPRELLRAYEQKVDQLAARLRPQQQPAFFLENAPVLQQSLDTTLEPGAASTASAKALRYETGFLRRWPIEAFRGCVYLRLTGLFRQDEIEVRRRSAVSEPPLQLEGAARTRIEKQRNMQVHHGLLEHLLSMHAVQCMLQTPAAASLALSLLTHCCQLSSCIATVADEWAAARGKQDTLTEELVGLAAGLKRNAAAMQTSVADRGRLLEDADLALERNLAGAKKSAKQCKVMYRKCVWIAPWGPKFLA
ncbi:hypothetical protein MMC29_000033 [Sticta canariensis]|nr:hypothetical protein [Sticta canariensis]